MTIDNPHAMHFKNSRSLHRAALMSGGGVMATAFGLAQSALANEWSEKQKRRAHDNAVHQMLVLEKQRQDREKSHAS